MSRAAHTVKWDVSTWQILLGYGYAWNCVGHYDDDATISHNSENRNSLLASSLFKGLWCFWQYSITEQTEIAILPALTRGLGRLRGIVGSFLRHVFWYVVNLNEFRSAYIRAPNFYFYFPILLYFIGFWQLVFAYFCPRVVGTTADFQHVGGYVPFFPQSGFGFSYSAVTYSVSCEICFSS